MFVEGTALNPGIWDLDFVSKLEYSLRMVYIHLRFLRFLCMFLRVIQCSRSS